MNNQLNRKLNFIKNTIKKDQLLTENFGLKYGILDFIRNVLCHGTRTLLGQFIDRYIYKEIEKTYTKSFNYLIEEYSEVRIQSNVKITSDLPIWVFWWQGINDELPFVVKKCVESIEKHKGNHPLIYVTEQNYRTYCCIPKYIIEKFENGNITITHFSDILRLDLLAKHGGIWIDATIYLTSDLPNDLYNNNFYTVHHQQFAKFHICQGKWSGFFFASIPCNPLVEYCRDFLFNYWENEQYQICYLLIDVAISSAYNHFKWAKSMIDAVPVNNVSVFQLQELRNQEFDEELFNRLCEHTNIHKLSYKFELKDEGNCFWKKF